MGAWIVLVRTPHTLIALTPQCSPEGTMLVSELCANSNSFYKLHPGACEFKLTPKLVSRLDIPRVLLVGLRPPTRFNHTPMIALGIASLAAVLRQHHWARVRMLDMRLGATITDVLNLVDEWEPDLIGISIDFGELATFHKLAETLYASPLDKKPLLFAGNYLAHLFSDTLLKRYPYSIICHGEGEQFTLDLIEYRRGALSLDQISGAAYLECDIVRRNPVKRYKMDTLPFPALDDLDKVVKDHGAVMLELTRGCSWNACTFCPRHHKQMIWRALPVEQAANWISWADQILNSHPEIRRRIYLCDEELIGQFDASGTEWLTDLSNAIASRNILNPIEINTRADQVIDMTRGWKWNLLRWRALRRLKRNGLQRILLGLESGSPSVLLRFKKGHSVEEGALAVRVITALGIDIRITFVTYDPLMTCNELMENYKFLGRQDILLRGVNALDELWEKLDCPEWLSTRAVGEPLFTKVCYLHNAMVVLPDSQYAKNIDKELKSVGGHEAGSTSTAVGTFRMPGNTCISDDNNRSRERPKHHYREPIIGEISDAGERWTLLANQLTYMIANAKLEGMKNYKQLQMESSKKIHAASYELLGLYAQLIAPRSTTSISAEIDRLRGKWQAGVISDKQVVDQLFDQTSVRLREVVYDFIMLMEEPATSSQAIAFNEWLDLLSDRLGHSQTHPLS
jgi:radical SAM superfamily enzyme YgiQ (UPF0313 family)